MTRLVILGGPGAGKGTQSQRICQKLNIVAISTGYVLREAVALSTNLGKQAQTYLEKGELVPDELIIEFIRQRLLQPDVSNGWLLEGYPRTAFQAEELDFLLEELGQKLNWAIYLKVKPETMMERSLARNLPDDCPEILQRRMTMFQERTIPILEYYDYCHRLLTINSEQSPDLVEQEIISKIYYVATS